MGGNNPSGLFPEERLAYYCSMDGSVKVIQHIDVNNFPLLKILPNWKEGWGAFPWGQVEIPLPAHSSWIHLWKRQQAPNYMGKAKQNYLEGKLVPPFLPSKLLTLCLALAPVKHGALVLNTHGPVLRNDVYTFLTNVLKFIFDPLLPY